MPKTEKDGSFGDAGKEILQIEVEEVALSDVRLRIGFYGTTWYKTAWKPWASMMQKFNPVQVHVGEDRVQRSQDGLVMDGAPRPADFGQWGVDGAVTPSFFWNLKWVITVLLFVDDVGQIEQFFGV